MLRTGLLKIAICIIFLSMPNGVIAKKKLSLLLTSNLEGRFSLSEENQERDDPFLLLGQCIIRERRNKRADLYIDLGNAFYPGALSKYSYGSVVSDFFHFFDCSATLISSSDIRIGVDNLKFFQKDKKTVLLSANILRDNMAIYSPYFEYRLSGNVIAFVGISSRKILFDIAEKNIYNIGLEDELKTLTKTIDILKGRGIRYIVVLSGLSIKRNINLLRSFKEIDVVISGGDNTGKLYGEKMARIDLSDGRTVIFLQKVRGYYLLDLSIGERIRAGKIRFKPLRYHKTVDNRYRGFLNRQLIWKRKFKEEEDRLLVETGEEEYVLDDSRISYLLRDRFDTEVSIVEKNTVNRYTLKGSIKRFELYRIVNDEYSVFTYNLSGSELKKISENSEGLIISGYDEGKVQGYPVDDRREYGISSTQRVYDIVKERLSRDIPYENSWVDISNAIISDLRGEKILFRDDYGYIERVFRATVDVYISSFFDRSIIQKGDNMPTPPGQPEITYRKWGMENKIDLTIYNRYHQFILTPYLYYIEEKVMDEEKRYLQNLLRGTFSYNVNLGYIVRPYHKSQCDTVIRDLDGMRPTMIRETVGANIFSSGGFYKIEGKIGAGFEKQIHEPVDDPIYGVEGILILKLNFLKFFVYSFRIDSFLSKEELNDDVDHLRSEMENSISFNINTFLSLSLKHKWFYLYKREYDERYSNSQIVAAIDIKTDFKIY